MGFVSVRESRGCWVSGLCWVQGSEWVSGFVFGSTFGGLAGSGFMSGSTGARVGSGLTGCWVRVGFRAQLGGHVWLGVRG
jgi:hypothetical protein